MDRHLFKGTPEPGMIILQIKKLTFSLMSKEKKTPFLKSADLEHQKIEGFFSKPLTFLKKRTLFSYIKDIQNS